MSDKLPKRSMKPNIQIEFDNKEYQKLLEAIYMADWICTAHKLKYNRTKSRFFKLMQKVYSRAKEAGYGYLAGFDKGKQYYFPTLELDGQCRDLLDKYDNDTFDLINRIDSEKSAEVC